MRPDSATSNRPSSAAVKQGFVTNIRRKISSEKKKLAIAEEADVTFTSSDTIPDLTERLIHETNYPARLLGERRPSLLFLVSSSVFFDADDSIISDDTPASEMSAAGQQVVKPVPLDAQHHMAFGVSVFHSFAAAGLTPPPVAFDQWCRVDMHKLIKSSPMLRLDLGPKMRQQVDEIGSTSRDGLCAVYKNFPLKGRENEFHQMLSPFSDAEVFQFFYLQLLLRALFDCEMVGLIDQHGRVVGSSIAFVSSGHLQLCFEGTAGERVAFPPNSNQILFTALENCRPVQPPAGCSQAIIGVKGIPCISELGAAVMRWAQGLTVTSPSHADSLLKDLFRLFGVMYRYEPAESFGVPSIVCRVGHRARARLLRRCPLALRSAYVAVMEAPSPQKQKSDSALGPAAVEDTAILMSWKKYIQSGDLSVFSGGMSSVTVSSVLGQGGSGVVLKGTYGPSAIPVAVKCFVHIDGKSHEEYVRECLTDLAFFALFNQLSDFSIASCITAYDFIVSAEIPRGMQLEQVRHCQHNTKSSDPKFCFLVTDVVDGTLGRFLTIADDDFDPCYDTLLNSPLSPCEMFQLLYTQLILRWLFNYVVHDVMLNGQLRGDNIGYKNVDSTKWDCMTFEGPDGNVISFPFTDQDTKQKNRLIYFIDVGQGLQHHVQTLTAKQLIGSSVVDSCMVDDGMGRYWPPNELYAKDIDVAGDLAKEARQWAAALRIQSEADAVKALQQLFELFRAFSVQRTAPMQRSLNVSCAAQQRKRLAIVYEGLV